MDKKFSNKLMVIEHGLQLSPGRILLSPALEYSSEFATFSHDVTIVSTDGKKFICCAEFVVQCLQLINGGHKVQVSPLLHWDEKDVILKGSSVWVQDRTLYSLNSHHIDCTSLVC
jgi:hypothetical protein